MKNKQFAGHLARDAGNSFEDFFTKRCTVDKIRAVRIPNAGRKIKTRTGFKVKLAKSPFDFLITHEGRSACVDTKTTMGKTFAHSMVVTHQLKWLQFTGPSIPSGYVIWFREPNQVVFFDHLILGNLKKGQSLKPADGVLLGPIENFKPGIILYGSDNDGRI